ncbi:MAG: hypothetical protein K5979_11730 [Ruminococcus sp.]|nr:hypothetical protein [Ruminococcus sp.]
MKIDNDKLFDCFDGDIPEQLPLLTIEERERMYNMSERKFNNNDTKNNENAVVSGVEVYSRPKWHKRAASIAAAAVLVLGVGGGAYAWKNGHLFGGNDEVSVSEDYQDILSIAKEHSDRYIETEAYFASRQGNAEGEMMNFKVVIDGQEELREYFKVEDVPEMSDSKIWNAHTISEIRANSLMDKAYFNETFGSFFVLCGVDEKSESEDMENGISKNGIVPKFIQYKNNIYASKIDNEPDVSMIYRGFNDSEPEIITQNDDSIVFRRTNMDGIAFEFSLSKDSDGEWKTTSVTKLDTESEKTESEELSIAYENSQRFADIMNYLFAREVAESDYVEFNIKFLGEAQKTRYYKVADVENGSPLWNAKTIAELKEKSLISDELWNELPLGCRFKDFSNYNESDEIVIDGELFDFPAIIGYNGSIYCTGDEHLAPSISYEFEEEPELISVSQDKIVFRRNLLCTDPYGETSKSIVYFTLRKVDGKWLTDDLEEEELEEVSEIVIDNAKKYFDLEKFIYCREASESNHIILKASTEDNGTDELKYCKIEDLDDDYYEIYGAVFNAHSIAELREGSCITDELFERRYSECFGEVNGDTVNTEFCLPRFIEYNGALYLSADYDASSYDIKVSGVPEIISSSPDKIVGRIPVTRHYYNEEESEITYEFTLIKNTEGEGWLTSDVENVNPAESSDETETNVKAVVKKYYDYEKYVFSKESFDYSKEVVYYCGDKTEENTMKYVPFKDADWNTVEKYEAQEEKFLGYIPERDIMDCSEYPSGHVFETDGADYLLPKYITIDGILYRLEEENPYVYDNISEKIADAEVELDSSDCAKVEITLDIKPSVKEKLTDSDRIKDKFEFWIKYENGEWKLEYKLNTTS